MTAFNLTASIYFSLVQLTMRPFSLAPVSKPIPCPLNLGPTDLYRPTPTFRISHWLTIHQHRSSAFTAALLKKPNLNLIYPIPAFLTIFNISETTLARVTVFLVANILTQIFLFVFHLISLLQLCNSVHSMLSFRQQSHIVIQRASLPRPDMFVEWVQWQYVYIFLS